MKEESCKSIFVSFHVLKKHYVEFMPGNPSPTGLIYTAGLIYGDMSEVSDNSVTSIYILLNWPHKD